MSKLDLLKFYQLLGFLLLNRHELIPFLRRKQRRLLAAALPPFCFGEDVMQGLRRTPTQGGASSGYLESLLNILSFAEVMLK